MKRLDEKWVFAETSRRSKWLSRMTPIFIEIPGAQITIEQAKKLRDWLSGAIEENDK